jgi:hypothetical protein
MVEVPSWLSVSEHDEPLLPFSPGEPGEPGEPAGPARPVLPWQPESAAMVTSKATNRLHPVEGV